MKSFPKPLESISLDFSSLDSLYPFHLIIDNSNDLLISHCGPALTQMSPQSIMGARLTDIFIFQRPCIDAPDYECLVATEGKLVCLAAIDSKMTLRGQLVPIDNGRILYLATLHVTTTHSSSDMGVSLATFPAHDLVPDLLILQRMKEIQLAELSKQNQELSLVIKERDQFDQFAHTDPMTQLFNRRGFKQKALEYLASENGIVGSALLLIDVDNFKSINDMYGHSAGDAVLQEIAERLGAAFGNHSVIGRWGGDEFVVLISCDVAYGLNTELNFDCIQPLRGQMEYKGKKIDISLSCGVVDTKTTYDLERLIHCADLTMYEGRTRESGKTLFFHGEMQAIIRQQEEISKLIGPAIDQREFVPYFQPIFDIASSTFIGFEALARWPSSELGMVQPLEFIRAAESKNLLIEFDYMMLDLVADQLSQWHTHYPDLKVHINLSAPTFTENLTDRLIELMQQLKVPYNRLVVEITETSLFISADDIAKVVNDLVCAGFLVELDDFGTGYSSLLHLKDFPVTGLKVDMSFVRDAEINQHTRKLLAGILNLSNSLNLHSVAEGVETEEQLRMLAELDCDSVQGYLFSEPLSAADSTALLEQQYFASINNELKKAA